jgi:hypothetical protein
MCLLLMMSMQFPCFLFFSSCQSLDFSTLYTKFDLADLKALMRVLINKVFNWMLKLHHF